MLDIVEFRRDRLPPLEALATEWRALEAVARPSFFTSWHWIGSLLAALPEAGRPELLRGFTRDGTVALALLGKAVARRRGALIRSRGLFLNETGDTRFDAITIEHNGVLAVADDEAAIIDALGAWFSERGDEADELHLRGSFQHWPESAVEARGLGRVETALPSYSVDLAQLQPSAGAVESILSANSRQQLRRAARHFERHGALNLTAAGSVTEALAFFDAMKALHCESWQRRGKTHAFANAFFEPFHRLLIARTFAEGGCQLLRCCAGDRVLGYLYNFRHGDRVYAYQSGFADQDRRERPGVVTYAMAIRHAFQSGARIFDFMAGRNRLKESFATRCEPMLWQVVQQPRLAFRVENAARRLRHRLRPEAIRW